MFSNRKTTVGFVAILLLLATVPAGLSQADLPGAETATVAEIEEMTAHTLPAQAVNIISPDAGEQADPGTSKEVRWETLANDVTGLDQLFRVELYDQSSGDLVFHTEDSSCEGLVDAGECSATVEFPDSEGNNILLVRMVATQAAEEPSFGLCAGTGDPIHLCDERSIPTGAPPATELSTTPEATTVEDGWFTDPVTVTLDCEDEHSGCAETYYQVNDGSQQVYDGPFTLENGEHTLTYHSVDQAGIQEDLVQTTIKQDSVSPDTTIQLDPSSPDGDDGWYTSTVEVTLACDDETSGCEDIIYQVGTGPSIAYREPFTVSDGVQDLTVHATDTAGNEEDPRTVEIKQDTVAPTGTFELEPADPDGENGWYVTAPALATECEDRPLISGCSDQAPLVEPSDQDASGIFTATYEIRDVAGNLDEQITLDWQQDVDDPVIDDVSVTQGESTAEEDDTIFSPTVTVDVAASDIGSGISQLDIWASNPDGDTTEVKTSEGGSTSTTLDLRPILDEPFPDVYQGDVTVHVEAADDAGRTTGAAGPSFTVDTTGEDSILLERTSDPDTLIPNDQALDLTFHAEWIGGDCFQEDASGATVELTDGLDEGFERTGTTDLSGVVSFSVTEADLQRELSATVTEAPCGLETVDDMEVQTPGPLTVTWTGIELNRLADQDAPRTSLNATTGEIYKPAYQVIFTYDGSPVEGAVVKLSDGEEFRAISPEDGIVKLPVQKDAPTEVTFDAEATFDPANGPSQTTTGDEVTIRWIELVFRDLTPDTEGWYDVTDEITFSLGADLDHGTGSVPAAGTEVLLTVDGAEQTVTLDENGDATTTFQFGEVTDATSPTVEPVSVPELSDDAPDEIVYDEDSGAFDRQRWTEVDLTATPDDAFVNVDDTVTLALTAHWAHDEDQDGIVNDEVSQADLSVNDDTAELTTCEIVDGAGDCEVTQDRVYDENLTLTVTGSSQDITRQLDGEEETIQVIWTQIVIRMADVDDDFVNQGDTVTRTALASYEHADDEGLFEPVPTGTIEIADGAPEDCELGSANNVLNGSVTVEVRCDAVQQTTIPLEITSAHEDVTLLSTPGSLDFQATWTSLIVSYTTEDLDGEPLENGTLLEHDEPVLFDATIEFAHGADAPDGTFFAFFVEANGETFNCITEVDTGTCVTEVSKHSGTFTLDVDAASVSDTDGDGLVEEDITAIGAEPSPIEFRWTSIGFEAFACDGSATGPGDCETTEWQPREIVTVTVTAAAQDTLGDDGPEILDNATITIAGETLTTDENGQADKGFLRFDDGELTVTARGLSAEIAGQTANWDTPRSVTLAWASAG